KQTGFTLIELLISMGIMLVVHGISSTLIARSFRMRSREDQRSDALADAQRALNIMTREIANAGVNTTTNGIVAGDSDATSIRIRSDLDFFDQSQDSSGSISTKDEDIKYVLYVDDATNRHYIVRWDASLADGTPGKMTVLANRVDGLGIHYYKDKLDYDTQGATTPETTPDQANFIVLVVMITLD